MDIAQLSQLGIGVATLGILLLVVRYFISALTKKDADIKELTDKHYGQVKDITEKYSVTVNNHIEHETTSRIQETKALTKLTSVISILNAKLGQDNVFKNRGKGGDE